MQPGSWTQEGVLTGGPDPDPLDLHHLPAPRRRRADRCCRLPGAPSSPVVPTAGRFCSLRNAGTSETHWQNLPAAEEDEENES